jgi:ACS family glucarate transporter-like MFS transporter
MRRQSTNRLEGDPIERTIAGSTVSPYRWVVISGFVFANLAMTMSSLSIGLLLPAITDSLDLSKLQGGWLGSSLGIGYILITIPAAVFLVRCSPVRLIGLSIALATIFTFLQGLATSFALLLLSRLAFGVGASLRAPARPMLAQQWHAAREIPIVNGVVIGLSGIGEAMAVAITPLILDVTDSWRTTLHIFGVFGLVTLAFWMFVGKERSTPEFTARVREQDRPPFRRMFRYPQLLIVGLGAASMTYSWFTFRTFWPTFMLDTYDVSLSRSGLLLSVGSLAMVPAAFTQGYVASRFGRRRELLIVSSLLMAGGAVGLLLTSNVAALVGFGLITGFAWGFMTVIITLPFTLEDIDPREIGVGISFIVTLFMLGGIVGPIVSGAVSDVTGSLRMALMISAILPVGLLLAAPAVKERIRPWGRLATE